MPDFFLPFSTSSVTWKVVQVSRLGDWILAVFVKVPLCVEVTTIVTVVGVEALVEDGQVTVSSPRSQVCSPSRLVELAETSSRVLASASAPALRLCAARILARDATALYRALNAFRSAARAYLGLSPAAREVS